MLKVSVKSTKTGRQANFEVEVKDENETMDVLQGLSLVHGFAKLTQLIMGSR
ncbi:MAG: hypothetical protein KAW84_06260 [Thermoplasmata archaeon]|nr:hypothetical protein [Thermoplasmata archaeon]